MKFNLKKLVLLYAFKEFIHILTTGIEHWNSPWERVGCSDGPGNLKQNAE